MTRQAIRSISALALLSLTGCTAGPFITNIEPLGNGKVRITEARVGLFGVRNAYERTYELNLNLMEGTLVTGTVSRVGASGNLITIGIQSGAENLKSGARFAIFTAADGYKGEATVSEVDESQKFCFARLTLKQGKEIKTGDNCSTNLSRSGD